MTLTIPEVIGILVLFLTALGLALTAVKIMLSRVDRLDAKNESRVDRLDAKNERAHAAITENIKAVDDRAERRSEAHRAALEAHRATLESIARDVSFLAGRQAERDRQVERASG